MRIARFQADGSTWTGTLTGELVEAGGRTWRVEEVQLLAPVEPSKIVCLGRNYVEHAWELGHGVPERPLLFFKPPSSVVGPGVPIVLPSSPRVDYEGELAAVIGRRCRRVPPDKIQDVVLGYTCLNDVTDRDAQGWEHNWVRAKGFDTACPLGPWVVTPDELRFPLTVETWLNGVLRQQADTSMLVLDIGRIIAEISRIMTLEPGDVIATGTPAGVGALAEGDTVEVRITGIGSLVNPVQGPAS